MGQQQSQGGPPQDQNKDQEKKGQEKKERKQFEPYNPPVSKKVRKGADAAIKLPAGKDFPLSLRAAPFITNDI